LNKSAPPRQLNRSMPFYFGAAKMADVATQENRISSGPLIVTVRFLAWGAPIALWLIHIFVIVPILNSLSGDAQFITAMKFFTVSALIMIGCFVLAIFVYFKKHSPADVIPLLLNLSWLYYVKVLFYGPTVGNL
jgi:hypothetical protein